MEKKANVTVLPAGFFWPNEKDVTVSTRESPMLPELNMKEDNSRQVLGIQE